MQIKKTEVTQTVYSIELTEKEAIILKSVIGHIAGKNESRDLLNNIYNKLNKNGVPNDYSFADGLFFSSNK